ncbi:hypothetical protein QFC22_006543 [Naganishia vaughanmartiniae]|uniref:Uncharacterized protein n=1 Tax=Naganishia vaughanmartiniae TaxID=1424756 RepID=A0ACC2WIK2_9TREE|nr:hypothetical protein QFC22_006543 [Naganishia vaughanmartiniae]
MRNEAETAAIRPTEERDLAAIAEILYERYKPCKWWQVINFEVDKKDWIKTTMNAMRNFSQSAHGASFVVEDKGAVVGSACYLNLNKDFEGLPDPGYTPGEKTAELKKIDSSSFKDDDPDPVLVLSSLKGISEFSVHLDYLGKDIAELMIQYIIGEAKKRKMNVALAAAAGEPFSKGRTFSIMPTYSFVYRLYRLLADEVGWHKNLNFKEIHPVRMLLDGTVPATNQMLLELFPATA